ncbi:MAG: BrnT family toxin, partial [Methylococcales bacterium]
MNIPFEWDEIKADANAQKHGVTFDDAATVFYDPLAVIFDDELHSEGEKRE